MSFIASAPPTPAAEPPIESHAFWPAIDPVQMRDEQRIDNTVTPPRLRAALIEAIAAANGELRAWRIERESEGKVTLATVDPDDTIDDEPVLVHRYRRAVGSLAKALLLERHRDFDATGKGDRQADALDDPISDCHRDYRHAISGILGIGRITVELI